MAAATKPKLVAEEKGIDGSRYNDLFDISLYQMPSGNYEVVVFMKVQFFFEDGADSAGKTLTWSDVEKSNYMCDWQDQIKTYWGGRNLKRLPSGASISVRFDFKVQEGGWMWDHWEIAVRKIAPGSFRTSSVSARWIAADVKLDSEDLKFVSKGGPEPQSGVVHEFGHMLGLRDEYKSGHTHQNDLRSVMNSGRTVKSRHYTTINGWLDRQIKKYNIE